MPTIATVIQQIDRLRADLTELHESRFERAVESATQFGVEVGLAGFKASPGGSPAARLRLLAFLIDWANDEYASERRMSWTADMARNAAEAAQ